MSSRAVYDRVRADQIASRQPPAESTGASRRKLNLHHANASGSRLQLSRRLWCSRRACRPPWTSRAPRSIPVGTKTCQDLASRLRNDAPSSSDGYEVGQRVLRSWLPIEHLWTLWKHDNVSASQGAVGKKLGTGFVISPGAFGFYPYNHFGHRRRIRGHLSWSGFGLVSPR